jgi:hypothetical protein
MHRFRTASIVCCALIGALFVAPAAAFAAAPALTAPAAKAPPATEGGSTTFEWTGALQGDPDTIERSFFRLEIIESTKLPSGAQSTWPEGDVENFFQTEPGQNATSASIGVPAAGEYRWRVCAWGVVDDLVANEIQQMPGGCSASRSLTTVAAAATSSAIGELKMEERRQVEGEVRRVYVQRPSAPAPVTPEPVAPVAADPVAPVIEPIEELVDAVFQDVGATSAEAGDGSALGLGAGSLSADQSSSREGIGGAILTGLGTTLPFVPIPFWTLALLLACFPLLRLWRRSVVGMFEWPDGSIDGRGTEYDDGLALVPLAQEVKVASTTADADAPASPNPVRPDAPDRRRRAA